MMNLSGRGTTAAATGIVLSTVAILGCEKQGSGSSASAAISPAAEKATMEPPLSKESMPTSAGDRSRADSPPAKVSGEAAPSTQPQQTFSKTVRAALQSDHDRTADNQFTAAVLSGKVTQAQYDLMIKQNLAVFECFKESISSAQDLPASVQQNLLSDLDKIILAFRADLNMKPADKLKDKDVLASTDAMLTIIRSMDSADVATCAYLDIGGNAFGTHDLAEAVEQHGITNTSGYTVYMREDFMKLVKCMNGAFTDPTQFQKLADAGRKFFEAHERMSNSAEFRAQ